MKSITGSLKSGIILINFQPKDFSYEIYICPPYSGNFHY